MSVKKQTVLPSDLALVTYTPLTLPQIHSENMHNSYCSESIQSDRVTSPLNWAQAGSYSSSLYLLRQERPPSAATEYTHSTHSEHPIQVPDLNTN